MAASLSDTLWSMTNLAEMVDASLPKQGSARPIQEGSRRSRVGVAAMPVWKEGLTHFFLCDVCKQETTVQERMEDSWDEVRMIRTRLTEEEWRFHIKGGEAEALCPDCAQ
jgi:hypothetical protein